MLFLALHIFARLFWRASEQLVKQPTVSRRLREFNWAKIYIGMIPEQFLHYHQMEPSVIFELESFQIKKIHFKIMFSFFNRRQFVNEKYNMY